MTASVALTPATTSMLRAMVDVARQRKYESGVLGVLAAPSGTTSQDLQHGGQVLRIRTAESALAAREVLREHVPGDWMVIVTDRDDRDLGAGILSHLVGGRLRRPDAWEALRLAFAATGVAPALASREGSRALAESLLSARPASGWPAAPAGVLTRTHAMASVARAHLGLIEESVDAITVLRWSMQPTAPDDLAALRDSHGDVLADSVVDWLAESTGSAEAPVRQILRDGGVGDLVPLGLALDLLNAPGLSAEEQHVAQLATVRLEPRLGKPIPHRDVLTSLASAAVAVITDLGATDRHDAHIRRVLARADTLLAELDALQLAGHSDILASGYRRRLTTVAEALQSAVRCHAAGASTVDAGREVERAWQRCAQHRLASRSSGGTQAFEAAVRLWRWVTSPEIPADADLTARVRAHLDHGAWADLAVNDVDSGVDDAALTPALSAIYAAANARRTREERAFAQLLAASTTSETPFAPPVETPGWHIEDLLPTIVLPAAHRGPVMLVVLDGMSAAAGHEIATDLTGDLGWVEVGAVPGASRRAGAIAVLPSLTEVSRASLLTGTLTSGGQDAERTGYAALTSTVGKLSAALFHKKGVDTTGPGALVAEGVGEAIDDTAGRPLVTIVLNTIDDALDRSDPAGTVWTADAVKHLAPLLARARAAGRTVMLTADHGHVVERRRGTQRSAADMTSGRSRGLSTPVQEDEVAVEGRRVLTDDHRAVLAVDDELRYGPLKAGYHGGASAREVVVPVIVLLPDEQTNPLDLPLLAPQTPRWWWSIAEASIDDDVTVVSSPRKPSKNDVPPELTLFGDDSADAAATTPTPKSASTSLGQTIVATETYESQRDAQPRLAIRDAQVVALVDALVTAAGHRLPRPVVATTLGVPAVRVDGALTQARQLLNLEGYDVVGLDPDGHTVVLDLPLLREQFGVR